MLVRTKGPCGPVRVPWCVMKGITEQFPPGHLWAAVVAVGSASSSGSSLLILILYLPGFHPSPLTSTIFSTPKDHLLFQGCPRTDVSRGSFPHFIAFPESRCCVFMSLCSSQPLRAAVPLPALPLSSASPFKPVNQALDAICLLQHVRDLSIPCVWMGQKALTYAARRVPLWLVMAVSALRCAVEVTGWGLVEVCGAALV